MSEKEDANENEDMNENKKEYEKSKCKKKCVVKFLYRYIIRRIRKIVDFLCEKHFSEYLFITVGIICVIVSGICLKFDKDLNSFIALEICSFLLIVSGIVLLMLEKKFEKNKMYFTEGEKQILEEILSLSDETLKVSLIRELISSENDN